MEVNTNAAPPEAYPSGVVAVVDDEDISRASLERIIKKIADAPRVIGFRSGAELIEWLDDNQVDLVITDYVMPSGMDGLELLRKLRQLDGTKDIPVMLITGRDDDTIRLQALEAGAVDYLLKPIDPIDCSYRVRNVLGIRRGAKRLEASLREIERLRAEKAEDEQRLLREAREMASAAAKAATDAKNLFVAKVSHEFRTPLQNIVSTVELLELRAADNVSFQVPLRRLRASADELMEHAQDLADLVRAESGKTKPRPKQIELRPFLDDTIVSHLEAAHEKGLALQCSVEDGFIWADEILLRRVVSNLVSNAVKYTNQGEVGVSLGVLKSDAAEDDGTATLQVVVRDTGIGIPESMRQTVFEPWVRSEQAGTQRGMGIGLYIVQSLVNAMKGSIDLESAEGVGTKITVRIPVETAAERRRPVDTAKSPRLAQRLLVIDDNDQARQALMDVLTMAGATVVAASSGAAALKHLAVSQFDSILIDLQMPEMDGYEAARQIRQVIGAPLPKIIGMSAYELDPLKAVVFDAFINKPVQLEEIVKACCEDRSECAMCMAPCKQPGACLAMPSKP